MKRILAVILCLTAACAANFHERETSGPDRVLQRAIDRAGGATALERATALTWEGEAVVHAAGRVVRIAGTWKVQPPDTSVVATYDVTRGPATTRSLVVAAPRGWMVRDGQFTPMPVNVLANERDAFWLYDVIRLVSLRSGGTRLSNFANDSLGRRGILAEQPGRPGVYLFVDATGRLTHFSATVTDAESGKPIREDVWLEGVIEADGIRWPRSMRFTLEGKPYFDLTINSLTIGKRVSDPLLGGPP